MSVKIQSKHCRDCGLTWLDSNGDTALRKEVCWNLFLAWAEFFLVKEQTINDVTLEERGQGFYIDRN
jgi:hypothetical protein